MKTNFTLTTVLVVAQVANVGFMLVGTFIATVAFRLGKISDQTSLYMMTGVMLTTAVSWGLISTAFFVVMAWPHGKKVRAWLKLHPYWWLHLAPKRFRQKAAYATVLLDYAISSSRWLSTIRRFAIPGLVIVAIIAWWIWH